MDSTFFINMPESFDDDVPTEIITENTRYVFIIMDQKQKIDGAEFLTDPMFTLYSPRTLDSFIKNKPQDPDTPVPFEKNEKVYYITSLKEYDIYHFVYKCRVNKKSNARFCFGTFANTQEAMKKSREIYSIVSGKKLPSNINYEEKLLIHRYMMLGLVQLDLFEQRNLSETYIENSKYEACEVSSGKHPFREEDSWGINVSNIFLGMMIDYYNITMNVDKHNSQRCFKEEQEYRKKLYDMCKEIFMSFLIENPIDGKNEKIYLNNLNTEKIIEGCVNILENYIM